MKKFIQIFAIVVMTIIGLQVTGLGDGTEVSGSASIMIYYNLLAMVVFVVGLVAYFIVEELSTERH